MMTMNVELSSLKQTDNVLSMLSAKGIPKNDISVIAPSVSHFMALSRKQAYDDDQFVMMFSWLAAIAGAAVFAIGSLMIMGFFSLDPDVNINFNLMSALVLFGIFIGGAVGFLFGHAIGTRRTLFKSQRIPRHPVNNNVVLKFPFPDERREELEFSLNMAHPVRIRCI